MKNKEKPNKVKTVYMVNTSLKDSNTISLNLIKNNTSLKRYFCHTQSLSYLQKFGRDI